MRAGRPPQSDRDLLKACREGDQAAWDAIVRKYRHLVYSIAMRSGLGEEDAADVFQAVFLSLLRTLDSLRQEETLIPWLVTATKRQSWKTSRMARRASNIEELPEPSWDAASAQDDLERLDRQVAVRGSLDRLDARCRKLLEFLFYSDPAPAYTEISRAMEMPVPSIGPTRIRCLEKLRRELGKCGRF